MGRPAEFIRHGIGLVAGAFLTFALWMVWLALGIVALGQIYIATRHELAVPGFVLRRFDSQLAEHGIRARFDRATFDPTGRILIESPRLSFIGYDDDVVTATAVYVDLNPWSLVVGRLEPQEVRVVDATVLVPAMLSPSGRSESLIRNIDGVIAPEARTLAVRHLSARMSTLSLSVRGAIARRAGSGQSAAELTKAIRAGFPEFCRQAIAVERELQRLEQPSLDLELVPTPDGGTEVQADATIPSLRVTAPVAADLQNVHAVTRFVVGPEPKPVEHIAVSVRRVGLPKEFSAHHVKAVVVGDAPANGIGFHPRKIELYTEEIRTPEGTASAVSATVVPRQAQQWQANVSMRAFGSALGIVGLVDAGAGTADLRFAGSISPDVLDVISRHVKTDVRQYFSFKTLDCLQGHATFGPKWKFQRLTSSVALKGIDAYGVLMDDGHARVELDPRRFYAPEAYGRIRENFARGSYEHHFGTHEFRFLLDGQLRPLDISGWFREWWPSFFARFEFPANPPQASVDVHGFWTAGRRTTVFVFADANRPVVLTQPLNRVRTRMFIRPGFYDTLEIFASGPNGGTARGNFAVTVNMATSKWRRIEVDAESTMPLDVAHRMAGELVKPILDPFEVSGSPRVVITGQFDGPDLGELRHQSMNLTASSTGPSRIFLLPFEDVAFKTTLRDDELTIDSTHGKFAGGQARLHAKVWGKEPNRRIGFDASLNNASLGVAVTVAQNFAAERKGLPRPPPGKFLQEKANVRTDIDVSAEGLYGHLLSFTGGGSAVLQGAELGQVQLFGPLSELLRFTSLRFTTANATYKLNGPRIEFPEVSLRGEDAAIDAHGEYALDRRQLDFRARVFPFQESGNVIKSVVGAVLTPISNALEVKLTGTLEKPEWAFVMGPTNLLRSLSPDEAPTAPAPDKEPVGDAREREPLRGTTTDQPAKSKPDLAPTPK